MHRHTSFARTALLVALAGTLASAAHAQVVTSTPAGTAFTYQGKLEENNAPANGVYDLEFKMYSGPTFVSFLVGGTVVVEDVQITNGLFTARVDFGSYFNGQSRWITVGVRPGSSTGAFTTLNPRQELTPAPYAIGLALPYSASNADAASLFSLTNLGSGGAMSLSAASADTLTVANTNLGDAIQATAGTNGNAINATSAGSGAAVRGSNTGTGSGVYGQLAGTSASGAAALYGYSLGSNGMGIFVRTENSSNPANTVEIQNNGSGAALHVTTRTNKTALFENTNAAGTNGGVLSTVAGAGIPIWGKTTGGSTAGRFDIDNFNSSANALEVNTVGTGLAAKFNGGDVQVWGNLYAETGTVLNRATPIGWGTIDSSQPTSLRNSSGNVTVTWEGNGVARVQLVGEGSPNKWVVITSASYDTADTGYWVLPKASTPLAVLGQPGTGVFRVKAHCIAGCNEFVPASYIDFVVYKGF